MMKKIFIAAFSIFLASSLSAQSSLQDVKERLQKINGIFDSSYFLQFNVKYRYQTDTSYGRFENYERTAKYIVKGTNFYMDMGDVEMMQNDTLSFMISHSGKTMTVSNIRDTGASGTFPLRTVFDSSLAIYTHYYNISIVPDEANEEETIEFITDSTDAPYKSFSITYDIHSFRPAKIEFVYSESETGETDTSAAEPPLTVLRNKKMIMLFSDYVPVDTDFGVFSQEKYIYFDPSKNNYIPSDKFRGYVLFVNGIFFGIPDNEEFPEVKPD
jgi:hypothetical protein